MSVKPSANEEEYFARLETERRRKAAEERDKQIIAEEREQARALHFMKCPKCGMQLEEIAFSDVRIDKCFNCEGLWLDRGELDLLKTKGTGVIATLFNIFR